MVFGCVCAGEGGEACIELDKAKPAETADACDFVCFDDSQHLLFYLVNIETCFEDEGVSVSSEIVVNGRRRIKREERSQPL